MVTLTLRMRLDEESLQGLDDFFDEKGSLRTSGLTVESIGALICANHPPEYGYIYWEVSPHRITSDYE